MADEYSNERTFNLRKTNPRFGSCNWFGNEIGATIQVVLRPIDTMVYTQDAITEGGPCINPLCQTEESDYWYDASKQWGEGTLRCAACRRSWLDSKKEREPRAKPTTMEDKDNKVMRRTTNITPTVCNISSGSEVLLSDKRSTHSNTRTGKKWSYSRVKYSRSSSTSNA